MDLESQISLQASDIQKRKGGKGKINGASFSSPVLSFIPCLKKKKIKPW